MKLFINGEERETAESDIAGLIAELGLPSRGLLVEHNGLALRPAEWAGRRTAEGDRVEIIRMVAGG